ncbi:hypothetical protein OAP02_00430 [Amylibacter sp.]|nr:hypothetical protein [Amylibacter sp.]
MTDKKQVKGLLDYISLKPDEKAEYALNSEDPYSEDYVSGMGLGATVEAKIFAKIGKLYHETENIKEATEQIDVTDKTKTLGRPKKQKVLELHQVRAFHLWRIAQEFPEGIRQDLTNRHMVEVVKKRGKTSHPLAGKSERLWTIGNNDSLEQSVSRGKTWWGIDHEWQSDKCYEFFYGVYPEKKP